MDLDQGWVRLCTIERPPDGDERMVLAVALWIHGVSSHDGVDPDDIRVDLICARDVDLTSWVRISVLESVYRRLGPTLTRLPVEDLRWPGSDQRLRRVRDVSVDDVRALLRSGPVRFVMADVGHPLVWVHGEGTFDVWKSEVRTHLAEPPGPTDVRSARDGYCYLGSEWTGGDGDPIVVLLEKHH